MRQKPSVISRESRLLVPANPRPDQPQLAVVDSRSVKTYCGANIRFQRRAKRQVASDTKPHGAKLAGRYRGMPPRQIVQRRAPVLIEMRDRSFGGIFQSARPPGIVERDGAARRLNAVINLRRRDYESVSRQAREARSIGPVS